MPSRAILLVDHGSRRPEANAQLEALAALVRARSDAAVQVAHMELAPPSIAEAFAACVETGAEEVVVVPCFLAPGRHASEDIPRLVAEAAAEHPVRWQVTDVLGAHPLLAELILVRAGLQRERFTLWRQDDNGNRYPIETFDSIDEANASQAAFEARGHKQLYWVERIGQNGSTVS